MFACLHTNSDQNPLTNKKENYSYIPFKFLSIRSHAKSNKTQNIYFLLFSSFVLRAYVGVPRERDGKFIFEVNNATLA